ncbi:hypothetical protein ACI5FR_16935 [Paenibacillus sp. HJGM_3]
MAQRRPALRETREQERAGREAFAAGHGHGSTGRRRERGSELHRGRLRVRARPRGAGGQVGMRVWVWHRRKPPLLCDLHLFLIIEKGQPYE